VGLPGLEESGAYIGGNFCWLSRFSDHSKSFYQSRGAASAGPRYCFWHTAAVSNPDGGAVIDWSRLGKCPRQWSAY